MYIAIEIQTNQDGSVGSIILPTSNDSFIIDGTFYTALAAAAVSNVPKHTIILLDNFGRYINSGYYSHEEEESNNLKNIVVEIQTYQDGNVGVLINDYDDMKQANNKYYTVLAAAAISELPQHAAMMFDNTGRIIKAECFGTDLPEKEE